MPDRFGGDEREIEAVAPYGTSVPPDVWEAFWAVMNDRNTTVGPSANFYAGKSVALALEAALTRVRGVRDDNEGELRAWLMREVGSASSVRAAKRAVEKALAAARSPQGADHEAEKDRLHRQIVRDCDAARDRELATRQELAAARRQRDDWKHRAEMLQAEADQSHARVAELTKALDDLLDWAKHIEGEGRLRRTEALEQATAALAPERTRDGS